MFTLKKKNPDNKEELKKSNLTKENTITNKIMTSTWYDLTDTDVKQQQQQNL